MAENQAELGDGKQANQPVLTSVQLARHLGVFDATMIGVGAMIGAGIFVLTGISMGQAGPAAVIAFALNGVVTLFTALSYAELSSAIPEAGGGYSFVKKVMPNSVAFASGWMLWFAYIVACSLYAKAFGSYFLEFFEQQLPAPTHAVVGLLSPQVSIAFLTLGIGLAFIAVNIIGTHASGQVVARLVMGRQRLQKFNRVDNLVTQARLSGGVFVAVINATRFQGLSHAIRGSDRVTADVVERYVHVAGCGAINSISPGREIADD